MNAAKKKRGFAVLATLLMVTAVAVILCAFLTATASDRAASHAIYNATRARLAAQAAAQAGMALLRAHFEEHPDSATLWEEWTGASGHPVSEGTTLYFHAVDETGAPVLRLQPLASGGTVRPPEQKEGSLAVPDASKPFDDRDNSADLNAARFFGDAGGWIGSPPGGRKPVRVPWVEMTDPAGRVTARYAFWIEDESFRLNWNALDRAASEGPGGVSLEGAVAAIAPALADPGAVAAALRAARDASPGGLFLAPAAPAEASPAFAEAARYFGTLHSAALNVTRRGARRLNLNRCVQDSADAQEIRRQLDCLIAAIRAELPAFGQRFYRLDASQPNAAQVSPEHAAIYLEKIAANLRDYLDTDSQPTIVNADRSIRLGKPFAAIEPKPGPNWPGARFADFKGGENSVIAVGKEAVPYFQEFGCRVRLLKFDAEKSSSSVSRSNFDFTLDYAFEFWNLTAKPIQLGGNAFLRIDDQAGFDTGTGTSIPEGRAIEIPIPETLVFPPGKVTVLTTDPAPPAHWIPQGANVVTLAIPASARRYTGFTTKTTSAKEFRVDLLARSTMKTVSGTVLPLSDYETKMVLGNDLGLLEGLCTLPLARGANNAISIHNQDDAIHHPEGYFYRGGSLVGSYSGSHPGDPRSNNEQLDLRVYEKTNGDMEQMRFYNVGLDNGAAHVPAQSTLGRQNANFVSPQNWPDSFAWSADGFDAPMAIADGPIKSIGELGHLYDPARGLGPSGVITYSRGGGRTLRVGQPDPLWDGSETSASREWAAWRLADVFSTSDALRVDGAINPNGVRRDGGAALKAALSGFRFAPAADPESDPGLAPEALSQEGIDRVVEQIAAWLGQRGTPFFERGELSEALAFRSDWTGGATPRYDRGREAIFRFLAERIATRGAIFSVYAAGQAITQTPEGKKAVAATSRFKLTFRLDPVWEPPLSDSFDPADPASVAARFRPPDRYRVVPLGVFP